MLELFTHGLHRSREQHEPTTHAFSGGGWHSLSALYGMIAGALDVLKDEGESRTPNRLLRGWMPFPPNQAEPGRSRNPIGHERHHGLQPSRPGEASVQTAFTLWRFHRDGQRPDRPDVNYWVITTNVSDLTKRLVDDLIFTPAQDIPSGNFISTEMLDETRRKSASSALDEVPSRATREPCHHNHSS